MDKRTRILAGFFGLAVLYVLVSQVVYPRWIGKWLNLDREIVKQEKELAALQALDDRVTKGKYDYREYLGRAGSQDITHVTTDVRDRLNQLVEKHGLDDVKVTPSRPVEDRKTGLQVAVITVSAGGALSSAVEFLRDVSELPHLIRLGNVVLSPASSSSRRDVATDALNIRVPVEVWALPDHRLVGRFKPEELIHPELYVRHQGRDYSRIWSGQPFQDYVPLVASLGPNQSVQKGRPAELEVTASGGRGNYTFAWTPSEGLTDPQSARTRVDTSATGTKRYTVTVADASGHTAQATATISITEPPKPPDPVVQRDSEPRPVVRQGPRLDPPWPDGQFKELRMALLRRSGEERLDEFMLYDTRSRETSYYKVGDEFDGGRLVYVHQTGGVARRNNEYFVYPLGMNVAQSLPFEAATEYPELQRAAAYHRKAVLEAGGRAPASAPGGADAGRGAGTGVGDEAKGLPSPVAVGEPEPGPSGPPDQPVEAEPATDGAPDLPPDESKPGGRVRRRPPRTVK